MTETLPTDAPQFAIEIRIRKRAAQSAIGERLAYTYGVVRACGG